MPKVLVVRFSSIGDIVLTTPVVRALKQQLNAEVHYITKKSFRGILAHNPHIDHIITIESKVSEAEAEIKAAGYDFVVDLHHNLRSMQVKRAVAKPSGSFPKLNVQKWMLVNLGINRMPPVHIVDRYFEAVKELGVVNDGKGLDYFIAPADEVNPATLPETHRSGYIAITAGAKFATKQLPADKLIAIINRLELPVVLLGGKEDSQRANTIAQACGTKVYNACGLYNLGQSASLVKQATRVIAHDTGLMHIAAAFHKRIHSVWGNTVPELGMTPYMPGEGSVIVQTTGLRCRPCSKIGYDRCPKGHFHCMNRISPDEFTV
ncbi:MAG: glycosyltransferase family 9 protein [Bacteroidia bacterium]|jgi:ADP-heptose:LPS heptosyltransferase|nr:glycosyltransferase family 9 protein [Bacteroidia bacterium]